MQWSRQTVMKCTIKCHYILLNIAYNWLTNAMTNSQTSDNKSSIPSWAAVSADRPYRNDSKCQNKYIRRMHCFPKK